MQIFYLDSNPYLAAQYLCDKHIVKMATESAQLLCITSEIFNGPSPWKSKQWKNHPCTKWLIKSKKHVDWLFQHGKEICKEYYFRYGIKKNKQHSALDVLIYLEQYGKFPKDNGWEIPPQVLPDDVKNIDTIIAYRNYYKIYKKKFARWKPPSNIPSWFQ